MWRELFKHIYRLILKFSNKLSDNPKTVCDQIGHYLIWYVINVLDAAPEIVEKPGDTSLSKLKILYIQAKELSENEVT